MPRSSLHSRLIRFAHDPWQSGKASFGSLRRSVLRSAGRLGAVSPVRWALGLTEVRDTDLFLVSYPRSGNTWVRYILAALEQGTDISWLDVDRTVPDLHQHPERVNAIQNRRIIKTHEPLLDAFPRVIYVHRDIREALVSYWFYTARFTGGAQSFSQFLRSHEPARHGSWKEHLLACQERLTAAPDTIHVIAYRDLREQFVSTVSRLAAWTEVGSGVDLDVLRDRTSLDSLTEEERRGGSEFYAATGRWFFDDRGQGLNWQAHWSAEDLAWLERDCELMALMETFGYR